MRLLFLSYWFPFPPDNGSKIRVFNLLKQLAARYEVDLVSFTPEPISSEQLSALKSYCRRIETVLHRPFQPQGLKARLGFFSLKPRSVVASYNPQMAAAIQRLKREQDYDLIFVSEFDVSPYALAWPTTPKLLDELQVATLSEQSAKETQPLRKARKQLMWQKQKLYVRQMLRHFDGCLVSSAKEYNYIKPLTAPRCNLQILPNGVDGSHYAGDWGTAVADTLIYSGALTFDANFDAVDFFLREIFPQVQAANPAAQISITGKLNGVPVERLPQSANVKFTGFLDDVRPIIARSWANIVPLRIGGGTRLKILESLALGTPVVATTKGAEGLELMAGRDLLIADAPSDFANAVLRLLRDAALRASLSAQGRQTVKRYDWQLIGKQLCDVVDEMLTGRTKPMKGSPAL